jgi:hypothetical protein
MPLHLYGNVLNKTEIALEFLHHHGFIADPAMNNVAENILTQVSALVFNISVLLP